MLYLQFLIFRYSTAFSAVLRYSPCPLYDAFTIHGEIVVKLANKTPRAYASFSVFREIEREPAGGVLRPFVKKLRIRALEHPFLKRAGSYDFLGLPFHNKHSNSSLKDTVKTKTDCH
jgi:hypothetical protein